MLPNSIAYETNNLFVTAVFGCIVIFILNPWRKHHETSRDRRNIVWMCDWVLSIGIITSCILPIFIVIGSITSFSQFAIRTMGNVLCPHGTTGESYSYETTTTDEFGNIEPATGVSLCCVDDSGVIVKEDPVGYSFLWVGIFALIGLIISATVAFALAAPLGVLIGRWFNRSQKPNIATNIEP